MIDISIVSGTYNRLPLLQRMVESCRASLPAGIRMDFILVDGGSTDGTIDWCKSQPDITLIAHGELKGAIRAFTDGALAATGKYVCLLNDDIEIIGDTLLRALVYLEENERCGGVCFADNRPAPGKITGTFACAVHPFQRNGQEEYSPYIQCGMVRRWLGIAAGWWGADDPTFTARTYAGDNYMSSRILEMGYTIDRVTGCMVLDKVADDGLRKINLGNPEGGGHPDSEAYYKRYPRGATFPPAPTLPNPEKRRPRILYLPILDPHWPDMKVQKRGLRDALAKAGYVYELDYLAYEDTLQTKLDDVMDVFKPDILFTQIHSAKPLTQEMLSHIRSRWPYLVVINWNGDVWHHGLASHEILTVLRHVDLQLVVNASTLPMYEQHNIPAAYWQIGYEEPALPLPDMPKHDIVFLANNTGGHGERGQIADILYATGASVGLYGHDWGERSSGNTNYDFGRGAALYRNARIAIGDNAFPDVRGFVSNRLFQALAAEVLLLHQTVKDLEELTGLKDGQHYIAWTDFADLRDKLTFWLDKKQDKKRKAIAKAGAAYVRVHHSFDARVLQLFQDLIPLAKRQPARVQLLVYVGQQERGGVNGALTGRHYEFVKGSPFQVDTLDVTYMLDRHPGLFTRVE